jgi:hypothetical protein
MISREDIAKGLFGAWMMARGDKRAAVLFDNNLDAVWKSFWAAALCLPAYLAIVLLDYLQNPPTGGLGRFLAAQSIAYVIGWAAYPLLMVTVTRLLERLLVYPRYIAAYNWANVITLNLSLLAAVLGASGLLPRGGMAFVQLIVLTAIVAYEGFIAATLLALPPWRAGLVVAIDLLLSFLVTGLAERVGR